MERKRFLFTFLPFFFSQTSNNRPTADSIASCMDIILYVGVRCRLSIRLVDPYIMVCYVLLVKQAVVEF